MRVPVYGILNHELRVPQNEEFLYVHVSIKIIKNEVGCSDDTVPKTVDTRWHCEEE